ncbi:MAG: hypothetical protein ACFFB5_20010 [Promethearchaeota archaeon]
MKRLTKIGLFISVTFLLLLMVPNPITAAETPDYDEGDELVFGYQETWKEMIDIGNDRENGIYQLDQRNSYLEIEDISGDELEFRYWDDTGEDDIYTMNISTDITINRMIFRPSYTFDDDEYKLVYISGPMDTFSVYFIDPDWKDINDNLADTIDEWEYEAWDAAGEKVDIKDFERDTETFTLMGKSDLNEGLDAFTETTHKWNGKFVFDGNIFYWDAEDNRYREYDSYELSWEIEFTNGGTLKKATQTRKASYEKITYEYGKLLQNKAVSLGATGGGLLPGVTHAFEFPIMILAAVTSVFAFRFIGKRKR